MTLIILAAEPGLAASRSHDSRMCLSACQIALALQWHGMCFWRRCMASDERAPGFINHGSNFRNFRTNLSSSVDTFVRGRFSRTIVAMVSPMAAIQASRWSSDRYWRAIYCKRFCGDRQVMEIHVLGDTKHLVHYDLASLGMDYGHMHREDGFHHLRPGSVKTKGLVVVICGLSQRSLKISNRVISCLELAI